MPTARTLRTTLGLLALLLVVAARPEAIVAQAGGAPAAQPHATPAPPPSGGAQPVEHAAAQGEAHGSEHAVRDMIARLLNFAVLVGVIGYFLRAPIAGFLDARSAQIRQDLVTAAETRRTATAQLGEIQQKLSAVPAELDALKRRGEEDVQAEKARIAQAAAAERARLMDQTRREIDMRLRMARRDLMEQAAELAVAVAEQRIKQTITPEDQLRLVDRYTTQLSEAR
jgi:F-type H+-transporting ATPase subunit b